VVGENRKADQVDAEAGGEVLEQLFDPNLSMIKILSADRVISHQEAAADDAIDDVCDCDFAGIDHLGASESGHGQALQSRRKQTESISPRSPHVPSVRDVRLSIRLTVRD
jgi:hypothetical protein